MGDGERSDVQKSSSLNTGSSVDTINTSSQIDSDFFGEGQATVIRKSSSQSSPKDWNEFEVTTNPVNDIQSNGFTNPSIIDDRFNPYGEADPISDRITKEAWSDEVRSPADGKSGIHPDRNAGDGLETPDEAEPKRNDLYDTSSQSESENEQYQVWRNELNEKNRRISGHSMSPFESESEDDSVIKPDLVPTPKNITSLNINNNNDKSSRGRMR